MAYLKSNNFDMAK
jgi:hypothetical protein